MRNNNTDFYETYYSGENYYVNGKTAFRKTKENSLNLSIEIKEYSSESFEEVFTKVQKREKNNGNYIQLYTKII